VEIGRRPGNGGQRATAVKCVGNVDRHLLLGIQELVVTKECECEDARQQQAVGQSPSGRWETHGRHQALRQD
jgi:hypothetical protein